MTLPLISIIVSLYNGERYLGECLDSILALDGGYPLQVIVADDASPDRTGEVLARYQRPPFEIVRHPRNIGAAAAINHAFGLVRGEFVARIDYDDRYRPNFLVDSMAALTRHADAAFVCSNAMMIDPDGVASVATGPFDHGQEPGARDRFRELIERHFVTAPTLLGRTSHWRRAIPIPAGMNFCDWYMNLVMAEHAPVVVLDKITADYRVHAQGMHVTKIRDGMGERVTFEVLERFLDRSPRSAELAPYARAIRAFHHADWGDKYFGVELDAEARRNYSAALRLAPKLAWTRPGLSRRLAGLTVGRTTYERTKQLVRRVTRGPLSRTGAS